MIYPELRFGRLRGGLRQHAVARRPRHRVRDRPFRRCGWKKIAERLGLRVDYVPGNWRRGASDAELESRLGADTAHEIKAVVVVHNETSTGVTSRIPDLRKAMDRANHPALLIVDAVSSLASIDYRHDEWGVDVTVCGSQKGLMVPPGLGFVAVSDKARARRRRPRSCRGPTGTGTRSSSRTRRASSRTRPPRTCSTASARRCRC